MSHWIFASKKIAAELGAAPEKIIEHATVVKDSKVRTVYDCGNYFLKLDRRKKHTFAKEFKAAQNLSAAAPRLLFSSSALSAFLPIPITRHPYRDRSCTVISLPSPEVAPLIITVFPLKSYFIFGRILFASFTYILYSK